MHIVVIEDEVSGRSKIARPGQAVLDGVRVLEVSSRGLLLEVDGKPLWLELGAGVASVGGRSEAPVERRARGKVVDEGLPMPGWVRLTLREYRQSAVVLRNSVLAGDIRIRASEQGGMGAEVVNAPRDGVLERLGLQPGDVVVAINGRPATDRRMVVRMLDVAQPSQVLPFAYHRGLAVRQGVVEITPDPGP